MESLSDLIATACLEMGSGSASWTYTGTDAEKDSKISDTFTRHDITTAEQAAMEMLPYVECIEPVEPLTYVNFLINVFNNRLQTDVSCFIQVCVLGDGRITTEYA